LKSFLDEPVASLEYILFPLGSLPPNKKSKASDWIQGSRRTYGWIESQRYRPRPQSEVEEKRALICFAEKENKRNLTSKERSSGNLCHSLKGLSQEKKAQANREANQKPEGIASRHI